MVLICQEITQSGLPNWQDKHLHGHGKACNAGRSMPCGYTFYTLTGMPLAHLRHTSLWLAYPIAW